MSELQSAEGGMDDAARRACEELALKAPNEFALVHGFLPAPDRDRLLALEALFRSLRDVPLSVSDPSVGIAKIAWWQQELRQAPEAGSQHPVVRGLLASGALASLDEDRFNGYLHALVEDLQEEPVASVEALRQLLDRTAGREALLLAGSAAPEAAPKTAPEAALLAAGSAARLLELLRTLERSDAPLRWLPLDRIARHQFQPIQGGDDEGNGEARIALLADLAEVGNGWRAQSPLEAAPSEVAGARFVMLRDALVGRRLSMASRRPDGWLERGARPGAGEVFGTWRLARRLNRKA